MISFIGDYTCRMDHKGRVVVPAAFRKEMLQAGESCVVLRRNIFESCIDFYPKGKWLEETKGLEMSFSSFNRKQSQFLREFFRGTFEVELDSAGRILIPKKIADVIGNVEEIVMVGHGSKVEIWGLNNYEEGELTVEEFEQLTEDVFSEREKKVGSPECKPAE